MSLLRVASSMVRRSATSADICARMSDMRRGLIAVATSTRIRRSSRSKTLAASLAFMFSYMVTRFLKRATSPSSLILSALLTRASTSLISPTRPSSRFSAAFSRLSRRSSSRARASSSFRRSCSRSSTARSPGDGTRSSGTGVPPAPGGGSCALAGVRSALAGGSGSDLASPTEPVTSGKLNICCAQDCLPGGGAVIGSVAPAGVRFGASIEPVTSLASSPPSSPSV